jgi:hypothetical protein
MITFNVTTQAVVDGVDHRCCELDRKWGIARLRLLVDDQLRARFDVQRQLFNAALVDGNEEQVVLHGAAMRRGWDALDAAATDAGAEPIRPEVWECKLPNGEVVAIVRTEAEAQHVCRDVGGLHPRRDRGADREAWRPPRHQGDLPRRHRGRDP